jgi:Xaa-Pro aminopeptidase
VRSLRAIAVLVAVASLAGAPSAKTEDRPLRGIPLAEYAARRAAAAAAFPDGLLVVRGTVEEEFGDVGRFRQNNWFMYLTGCETPGAFLVVNTFAPPAERDVLYLPARNPAQERWTGPQVGAGEDAERAYGVHEVRDQAAFAEDLRSTVDKLARGGKRPTLYTVAPSGADARYTRDGAFADSLRQLLGPSATAKVPVADATAALAELRRAKSPAELAQLARAIAITLEAERDAAKTLAPGRAEYEVEAAILAAFVRNGSQRPGFPSIVGSGAYSTVLHYNENTKRVDAGDLVVVDIGAEYNYYTADITRTFPASGRFTPRQREVYQLVLDAQEAAARAYAPRMTIRDLHAVAVETMRRSPLRDARGATLDMSFIHGLSHYLGMDVHDVGDVSAQLRPGDVITIEPGIYLPEEKLGVRIEDDYLVTETGLVKLSKDLPSTPDEIERLVGPR